MTEEQAAYDVTPETNPEFLDEDALETLARAYLADAGEDAPEADLARAILEEKTK